MERFIIALQMLGIKNENLIFLLSAHIIEIPDLFRNPSICRNSLDLFAFTDLFADAQRMKEALEQADKILQQNEKYNIKTTYYLGKEYPNILYEISNPPAVIYYQGAEFADISRKTIACVGTRRPTSLSYNAVNYLVPQWINEGCSIVSGLACGVDKISHQACISAGGVTVAVLAHGLDMIYPKENKKLAERILGSGGILISEYPVGTKPEKFRFVDRNRLIVGLSKAVVIYECETEGGTMHSVEFAKKQGKPMFCPLIADAVSEVQIGTKKLLDEGTAQSIKAGRDIEKVLIAMGSRVQKPKLSIGSIKKNYLNVLFNIANEDTVILKSIKNLNLTIPFNIGNDQVYGWLLEKIYDGETSFDNAIQELVKNNITSIESTLRFEE